MARTIIRFEIDGEWSAEEMGQFFVDLDELYMLLTTLQTIQFRDPSGPRGKMKHELRYFSEWIKSANPHSKFLQVIKVQYGSPGIQDLVGVGEIVGHIKEFILKIIENISSRRERELKNTQLELENARQFLQLRKDYDLNEEELLFLVKEINTRQRRLEKLIREGKIITVKEVGQLPE
jgi:hypothetical protein